MAIEIVDLAIKNGGFLKLRGRWPERPRLWDHETGDDHYDHCDNQNWDETPGTLAMENHHSR